MRKVFGGSEALISVTGVWKEEAYDCGNRFLLCREFVMKNVTIAKSAGFCFGVANAVDMVFQTIETASGPVYTYGPIIHNEYVVGQLLRRGVRVIGSEEELDALPEGTVLIRSHGVSRHILEKLDRPGITVIDATCPFVKKIHRIAEEAGSRKETVIIAGDPSHPEVIGTCYVVRDAGELKDLCIAKNARVLLLAQTTYNYQKFKYLVEILQQMNYHFRYEGTICNATMERQKEAAQIAKTVDAMIVIGDRHSSNTCKLYEICKSECKRTYFVENPDDLRTVPLKSFYHVGITAGASTPKKLIEEVHAHVRNES